MLVDKKNILMIPHIPKKNDCVSDSHFIYRVHAYVFAYVGYI